MQSIRIYEMPDCKMVPSGKGMFGEKSFDMFEEWFSSRKRGLFPKDLLSGGEDGSIWFYMFEDGMSVPPPNLRSQISKADCMPLPQILTDRQTRSL